MSLKDRFRSAGAAVLAPIGGAGGLLVYLLDKAVTGGRTDPLTAIMVGAFIGLGTGYMNVRRQLEGMKPKLHPRLEASMKEVPFFVLDPTGRVLDTARSFNLKWTNNPDLSSDEALARDIRGFVSVYRDGRLIIDEAMARWDETAQPEPMKPTAHLAAITLGIGESRTMALVVLFESDACPYFFNNDSYQAPRLQKPEYRLDGQGKLDHTIEVRVRGPQVDARATVRVSHRPPARPTVDLVFRSSRPPEESLTVRSVS